MIRFLVLLLLIASPLLLNAQSHSVLRSNAHKLEKQGNFKEALKIYEELISKDLSDFNKSRNDLERAVLCQNRLNLRENFDSLIDTLIKQRPKSWEAYATAGYFYIHKANHNGRLVNGK
ncbi:MAG: hypothetical protein NE330_01595, partial [Lentisphaeraceae bacterium]|nr:hypothetical protein [Lentisphaeraceae bacterium]